jgi:hypothetical protein
MSVLKSLLESCNLERYQGKDSGMIKVNDYVRDLKIEHLNLFKLMNFLNETKIANKLIGFQEKILQKTQSENSESTPNDFISKHLSALKQVEQFIQALLNPDENGRVIIFAGIFCFEYRRKKD